MIDESGAESPRILLLTNNKLQPYTGGGILLANLFHKVSPDRMFILHADPTVTDAAKYQEYRLQSLRMRAGALVRLARNGILAVARSPRSVRRADLAQFVIQSCYYYDIPDAIDAKIREFKPDVIYAWVGDSIWARLLEDCAKRYNVPFVIHFMDNHVEVSGETPLQRASHAEFRRSLSRLVDKATRIFTISPAMGVAYRGKFGKPYDVFHGLIDKAGWPWPTPKGSGGVFRLAFTGSVESGQLNGLRDVAAAVDRLADGGEQIELVLYLTEFYERRAREALKAFKHVVYRPHPPSPELRPALTDADMLVLAYGFDEPCIQYYRYSFATKVVPYMLSGRSILAYGPSTIEPIAYVRRGEWAHVVSEPGVERLAAEIARLMKDPARRENLARVAYEAGLKEHDLELNSQRFLTAMTEVANHRASA